MKFSIKFALSIAAAILSTAAVAVVDTDDIKVGSILDSTGIKVGGLGGVPLPLPPGAWEVVSRVDGTYALTREAFDATTTKVSVTLHNADSSANIAVMMISYSPVTLMIDWKNGTCESAKALAIETNETTTSSLGYSCVKAIYNHKGGKAYVEKSADSTNPWVKTNITPLIPFLKDIPETNVWVSFLTNHRSGRMVTVSLMAKAGANYKAGSVFDQELRAWMKSAGSAYLAFVGNSRGAIPDFPSQQ